MRRALPFKTLLDRYAACVLELGVALRPGQFVLVSALTAHRDLSLAVAAQAYRRGASFVNVLFQDERLAKIQLESAGEDSLEFVSQSMKAAYQETVDRDGVFISLSGREDLKAFQGIAPERQSRLLLARQTQLDFFYQKIFTNQIKWCVASAATPGTATVVFPRWKPERAVQALWDRIFSICRVYESDPVSSWAGHLALLEQRKRRLNELRLRELRFLSPTCDLSLRLNERARWQGGFSKTPRGERFLPNIPTEEVFTVPDYRSVEGSFHATRPLTYKNIHLDRLRLAFQRGKIVSLEGSDGVEELRHLLSNAPAHGRVGEIALVDSSSAVARSGLVFHDLLYDENAQSHLALGAGYAECLEGSADLSEEERDRAGFNSSPLHIDIMLGSPNLTVTGRDEAGGERVIMRDGIFVIE